MIFYLSYIGFVSILLILNDVLKVSKDRLELLAVLLVIFITGIRINTGYDYISYSSAYDVPENGIQGGFEPLFQLYWIILRACGFSYVSMFFISGFIIYTFIYLGIKKYTNHSSIAFMIFLLIPGLYLNTFSVLRSSFALSISFYAYFYLRDKKYFKYILFMVVAMGFHYSVIVAIIIQIFVFIYKEKINIKSLIFVLIFSIICSKYIIPNLSQIFENTRYAVYFNDNKSVSYLKIFILNVFSLFLLLFYNRFSKTSHLRDILIFSIISSILLNLMGFSPNMTRLCYYFKIFEIVMVAEIVYKFNPRSRYIVLLLFIVFYLSIFINALIVDINTPSKNNTNLIPYKNIFQDDYKKKYYIK